MGKDAETKTEPTPDFDAAMAEVERIIESIESGELELEDSIRSYERAAVLMKSCRAQLRAAEVRVEDITKMLDAGDEPDAGGDAEG